MGIFFLHNKISIIGLFMLLYTAEIVKSARLEIIKLNKNGALSAVVGSGPVNSLPYRYDSELISTYFAEKPSAVTRRLYQLTKETISIIGPLTLYMLDRSHGELFGRSLRESIVRLGPTFIKLGQALASRYDLIDVDLIKELQLLQDSVSPFSSIEAKNIIVSELNTRIRYHDDSDSQLKRHRELLDSLSLEPVASASIGQVYKANVDGREVAVKVQRPFLREEVSIDFLLARSIASAVVDAGWVRADIVGAIDEYASRLYEELDYLNEAANIKRFGELYSEGGIAYDSVPPPGIVIPTLLPDLCTDKIITMTWLNGTKLISPDAKISANDSSLINVGIRCTLSQLLDTGFLHCDPHGGNLLRSPDGKLAYLDFGLVATIPPTVRDALVCSVLHLVEQNYAALAGQFDDLMLLPKDKLALDKKELEAALQVAIETIFDFTSEAASPTSKPPSKVGEASPASDFTSSFGNGIEEIKIGTKVSFVEEQDSTSIPETAVTISSADTVSQSKKLNFLSMVSIIRILIFQAAIKAVNRIAQLASSSVEAMEKILVDFFERRFLGTATLRTVPRINFGAIIGSLVDIAMRFELQVPPYFINNVRALATLEGMAIAVDPQFNILTILYPFVLEKLLRSNSDAGDSSKLKILFRSMIFESCDADSGSSSSSSSNSRDTNSDHDTFMNFDGTHNGHKLANATHNTIEQRPWWRWRLWGQKRVNWNRLRDITKQATSMGISPKQILRDISKTASGRSFLREILIVAMHDWWVKMISAMKRVWHSWAPGAHVVAPSVNY